MKFGIISKLIPQTIKNNALYALLRDRYINISERKVSRLYSDYEVYTRKLIDAEHDNVGVIMGTGPSLNKINMDSLKEKVVVGVNNSTKAYPFQKYHIVSDVHVLYKHKHDLAKLKCPLFLTSVAGLEYITHPNDYNFFNPIPIRNCGKMTFAFADDITKGMYDGGSVIVSAIQLAFHLGFKDTYLIGCDCDYTGVEHFDGAKVCSKTRTYRTGDWTEIFRQFDVCRQIFENAKRNIYNATIGGKLEVFERRRL